MAATEQQKDEYINKQKLINLRASLSHLTKHLYTVTDKLVRSQGQLSELQRAHARESELLVEERDGARALAGVWEARWRDERNQREAIQAKLASSGSGVQLNHRQARTGATQLVISSKLTRHQPHSSSSAEESSSSSEAERTYRRTPAQDYSEFTSDYTVSTAVATRQRPPRVRTRQLVADLSRELERVRREADRLLADRDEEIARLEDDAACRRQESATFYASVDKLLSLGTPITQQPQPQQFSPAQIPDPVFASHARSSSVLDQPAFQLAASHSRTPRAAALEAEVRHLELELQQMAKLGLGHSTASHPSGGLLEGGSLLEGDKAALAGTISQLNAQVSELRRDLAEVTSERAALKALYEQTRQANDRTLPSSEGESDHLTRHSALEIARLEADKQRLGELLHASENESMALSHQLSSTQDQVELISERVKMKLMEQRGKLDKARERIAQLEEALQVAESALEEARRQAQS